MVENRNFPAIPEVGSPTYFVLLRAWLRWCDGSHNCTRRNAKSKAALPSRLLDLRNPTPDIMRLFCPKKKDGVKYAALSHCWGQLTDENKRQFCTTDDNIEERLKGFTFSELSKTFQDAIRVTRGLGIQYLWIDSLCIIQGNQKDWEHEAKRMEGVYASAYCTIAATSAVDSNAGFLERNVSNKYVHVQDASGRRFYVCTDIDGFDNDVDNARLNKRAWVMQERVLSRRTIHFTANQVYFECGEGIYCENFTMLKSSFRKKYFMLDPEFPARLLGSGNQRTMEFIQFLSEEYSRRGLTEKTDRCVAISGLEDRIARARKCQTRYGVFQPYLHRNLLWQRSGEERMKRIGYKTQVVPSWSWMAYDGSIRFMDIPFEEVDWMKMERRDTSYAILDSSKAERGWVWYDVEASEDLDAERCVVVGREDWEAFENKLGLRKYYILIVRPTSVDNEYTRVGVGWIQSDYVTRQRLNMRVV
ncbi:HET-domain-containing protein [Lentithecium fluviatile CBS 122367]|uniref:HET-domain-containing protein n=1 Tax=Lentithecium fluviatile CBS 122367 TaxID=1168545 RepID=A0A6G1ILU1_9PLEO|nr:HET-domain-containing protein [Lentithecium fluviatile CBS 122367]